MPRYFIDTRIGNQAFKDDEGEIFADDRSAHGAALSSLEDFARITAEGGETSPLFATVRNEAGGLVCTIRVAITTEWHREDAEVD